MIHHVSLGKDWVARDVTGWLWPTAGPLRGNRSGRALGEADRRNRFSRPGGPEPGRAMRPIRTKGCAQIRGELDLPSNSLS